MMGTFNCVYETPCGWCSKWDKKCDKKAGTHINNECKHAWESCTNSTSSAGITYRCRLCGAIKTAPYGYGYKVYNKEES